MKDTKKQPYYQTWWFWLVVILVIAVFGAFIICLGINGQRNAQYVTTAAQVAGSDGQVYAVGETLEFDGGTMTVESAAGNYRPTDSDMFQPADGNELMKVTVTLTNTGEQALAYNALDWQIQNGSDEPANVAGVTYSVEGTVDSGELAPGDSITADLYYEVPERDSGLTLQFTPESEQDRVIVVGL